MEPAKEEHKFSHETPKKVLQAIPKERHSRTGSSGAPKKGGAGGKGTWGKPGDEVNGVPIDPNDPDYISDEEDEIVLAKVEVGVPFEGMLKEYFSSGDVDELAKTLKDLKVPQLHSQFVKKSLRMAIERTPYDRELLSKLLSSLYGNLLSMADISDGFLMALRTLPDVILDAPDAPAVLGKFLARAIFDEIVPPAFLKNTLADFGDDLQMPVTKEPVADPGTLSPLAKEAVDLANALITEEHRSSRLLHIWGAGDMESVKRLKEEVDTILNEYLVSGDVDEADRCIRQLSVPTFHFQIVKQAVRTALTNHDNDRKKMITLLQFLRKTALVSADHMSKGFKLCFDNLEDLKCDVPNAEKLLNEFTLAAKENGVLPSDFKH